jgi:hypothetical protein
MSAHLNPWHLASSTRLTASAARQAAASEASLPLGHVDGGVASCPAGAGPGEILVLAYPGRPDIDLWLSPGGDAANGYVRAGGPC